jgi:hypothetical protein
MSGETRDYEYAVDVLRSVRSFDRANTSNLPLVLLDCIDTALAPFGTGSSAPDPAEPILCVCGHNAWTMHNGGTALSPGRPGCDECEDCHRTEQAAEHAGKRQAAGLPARVVDPPPPPYRPVGGSEGKA